MAGDFDEARSRCREGKEILEGLGRGVGAAAITTWSSAIELLAGDPVAAERDLRPALEQLQELGERGNLASIAAQLAEALHAQGRSEEALTATVTSEEASSPDDVHAQISWRVARAKALAQLGARPGGARDRHDRRRARRHRLTRRSSPPRRCSRSRRRTQPRARRRRDGTPLSTRSSSSRRRGTWLQPAGRARSARNWRHVQR